MTSRTSAKAADRKGCFVAVAAVQVVVVCLHAKVDQPCTVITCTAGQETHLPLQARRLDQRDLQIQFRTLIVAKVGYGPASKLDLVTL